MMSLERNGQALKQIGLRIREARERLRISREELADRLGKTLISISRYETGERSIDISSLPLLSELLDVPMQYFFTGDSESTSAQLYQMIHRLQSKPEYQQMILQATEFLVRSDNATTANNEATANFTVHNAHNVYSITLSKSRIDTVK